MHEAELFRKRLLEDFKPSLNSNRFMVFFQPKYDIRPDRPLPSSAKALVRWDHPELGMISPGVFIPLLEDNGLILELDQFVWREAAARIRDWKDRFGYSVPVSVNVSRIDMLTPNLKSIFKAILEEYRLNADDLHVPVVAEGVETEEQYLVLKAMGCDLVQGYYFSKPVPPEAFDHFLIERAGAGDAVTPAAWKTYMSVSKALTSDFESIFHVDVITDFYLEFFTGKDGDLEIRPGGIDFFEDARKKILEGVCEPDVEKARDAINKANRMRWIGQEEAATLSFFKLKDGKPASYTLQTIKTRESDSHHIVIGVRQE